MTLRLLTAQSILDRFDAKPDDSHAGRAHCPVHEADGDGHNPSLIIDFTDTGKALLHCESKNCSVKDMVDAVGLTLRDLSNVSDAASVATRRAGSKEPVDEETRMDAMALARLRAFALAGDQAHHDEFLRRGLDPKGCSHEDLLALGLGWDVQHGEPTYTTFSPGGQVAYVQRRTDDERVRWMSDKAPEGKAWDVAGFIGTERHPDRPLLVTEGPADGLTAATADRWDVVAVRGAAMANKAAPLIAQEAKGRVVILAGDNDEAGREFNATLAIALAGVAAGVKVIDWPTGYAAKYDIGDLRHDNPESFGDVLTALVGDHSVTGPVETRSHTEVAGAVTGGWDDDNLRGHQRIAARFAQYAEGRVMYVSDTGWCFWDGTRWAPDKHDTATNRLLTELLTICWPEALGDRELTSDLNAAMSAYGSKGVLELASHRMMVTETDTDPYLLNVRNGTLNLRTLELQPHDPADRITVIADVDYNPAAKGESWHHFLETSMCEADGTPMPDVLEYLQRLCGYALLGVVRENILVIMVGKGRNGKGTFMETLESVLGDSYYGTSTNDILLKGKYADIGKRTAQDNSAILSLKGKRMVALGELDDSSAMDTAAMKALTGGDTRKCKGMGRDYETYRPSDLMFMPTNKMPSIDAYDDAVWRRLRIVPWRRVFTDEEADPDLKERLSTTPDEREACLAWMVEGLRRYWEIGLTNEPDAVIGTTKAYKNENDTLALFLTESVEFGSDKFVSKAALKDAYAVWLRENDAGEPLTGRALKERLGTDYEVTDGGGKKRRYGNGRNPVAVWLGMDLKPAGSDD